MAQYTMATLAHGEPRSTGRRRQQRDGNTRIPARASPRLGRRWRGGAMEATNGGGLSSTRGSSRERGKGAVRAGGAHCLLQGREGGGGGRDRWGGGGKWHPQWSHYQSDGRGGNVVE
jgi:hypothetical protein